LVMSKAAVKLLFSCLFLTPAKSIFQKCNEGLDIIIYFSYSLHS